MPANEPEGTFMIGYVTLGTNDLDAAARFYDELLASLGARRAMNNERMIIWSAGRGQPMLALCKPYDQQAATCGNGTMVALNVGSQDKVREIYSKALELGGGDEGEPGQRMPGFYGGYFRDLDGNKLVAYASS
jgi:predicted lactoylglutathione lyase